MSGTISADVGGGGGKPCDISATGSGVNRRKCQSYADPFGIANQFCKYKSHYRKHKPR